MTLGPRLNSHVLRISQLKPGAWVFDREELEQVTARTPVRRESKFGNSSHVYCSNNTSKTNLSYNVSV